MRRLDLSRDERDELDERAYRDHVQRELDDEVEFERSSASLISTTRDAWLGKLNLQCGEYLTCL